MPGLLRSFDIRRASVRLLAHDRSEVFIVAVWSDPPTALRAGTSYRSTVGTLRDAVSAGSWPFVRRLEPCLDPLDSVLYEGGIRSFAIVQIPGLREPEAFLSVSSTDPDAFEGKDLSELERAAVTSREVV